ncbi:MAG: ABC transporter permease [Erysipelotrichales bacterium]|nr:ABC transporter permease [Erysipelotrichales bacterium]
MEKTKELKFESPSFIQRLKGMLGVDFYRLFHTPLFYIFLAIAAIIPALVSMGNSDTTASMFTNAWQIIASDSPLYVVSDIGQYANMNMVFIFGGIMVSIFIGHDYKSGYVKQLFTTHAKKQDYMMSKSLVCAFSMACMCITYLIGGIASGIFSGLSFEVNFGSLLIAILGKMIMSLGWASLYTFLNAIFRRKFGISIALSFFLGTGILIIGVASIVGNSSILNLFLYGSSVYACLSSNIVTLLVCLLVSVGWATIYNLLGTLLLSKRDVY